MMDEQDLAEFRSVVRAANDIVAEESVGGDAEGAGHCDAPDEATDPEDMDLAEGCDAEGVEDESDGDGDGAAALAERIMGMRRSAVALEYRTDDLATAMVDMGVVARDVRTGQQSLLDVMDQREIALLTVTFRGTTIQSRCRSHGAACSMMLSAKPALGLSLDAVKAHSLLWAAAGTVCDAAAHSAMSLKLRREVYRMRVYNVEGDACASFRASRKVLPT
mmetsp:Transcript_4065/g.11277  ORF Transcript_4065/g.11277 Transcript_4065/m.11277 type:complete len:220 (+) Transcript_4065:342-1001(+)